MGKLDQQDAEAGIWHPPDQVMTRERMRKVTQACQLFLCQQCPTCMFPLDLSPKAALLGTRVIAGAVNSHCLDGL